MTGLQKGSPPTGAGLEPRGWKSRNWQHPRSIHLINEYP